MRLNNSIWRLFASVQLAIFIFVALASTSIIGTVIPQKRPLSYYTETYGDFVAQFIYVLDIQNMYSSWWFSALLFLLTLNLIICSIDRFPVTQGKVKAKNLNFSKEKLSSMPFTTELTVQNNKEQNIVDALAKLGWKTEKNKSLLFSQKFAWSHYGVYLVHISIIVIFAGAMIGGIWGYKGSVMIPETLSADQIYSQNNSEPIPLGFEVRCDEFDIEYYDTGMPKTYRSRLSIFENNEKILTRDIEVNKPLIYKGVTFYQASYEGFQSFIISIIDRSSGEGKVLTADYQKQIEWAEKNIKIGVLNAMSKDQHVEQVKLWFFDGSGEPIIQWLENDKIGVINSGNKEYELVVKQMYATGLQTTKDPGVWYVYLGCTMLLLGLVICFFLSHKKIWLIQKGKQVFIAGTCNKNKPGFEKEFNKIKEVIEKL